MLEVLALLALWIFGGGLFAREWCGANYHAILHDSKDSTFDKIIPQWKYVAVVVIGGPLFWIWMILE